MARLVLYKPYLVISGEVDVYVKRDDGDSVQQKVHHFVSDDGVEIYCLDCHLPEYVNYNSSK